MSKTNARCAALPFRRSHGQWEVLLVTTRRSGRWVVPKGRPIKGRSAAQTAKIEALEEAGVTGAVSRKPIGYFEMKSLFAEESVEPDRIEVYPLAVSQEHVTWKEDGERRRRWLTFQQAAKTVDADGLRDLLCSFEKVLRSKATR